MALRCVFHLNIAEAMLLQKKERKEDDGYSESKGPTERQEETRQLTVLRKDTSRLG